MKWIGHAVFVLLLVQGGAGCDSQTPPANGGDNTAHPFLHGTTELPTKKVTLGGRVFTLELALDAASRKQGLMFRESLPEDGGMLFVFPESAIRSFWMKNCLMDLDIIFMDSEGYVTATHMMTAPLPDTPEDYLPGWSSVRPAQFAIEIRPGLIRELGIQRGDLIKLPLQSLKYRAE